LPLPTTLEDRFESGLTQARELGLLERACDSIVALAPRMPASTRRPLARKSRRLAISLRRDAHKNGTRSTLSFSIGTTLGFGLFTGSLLALGAAKAVLPFIILASFGAFVLSFALPAGYYFANLKADQEHDAALLDTLAEDLEQ
jgi:hypothetical protein